MNLPLRLIASFVLLISFFGCTKTAEKPAPAATAVTKHEHKAPHGGTPVVLGNEAYHLELVRDAAEGKLTAYVLDGEMENFIRIKAPSLEVVANLGGEKRPLTLRAAANAMTGETVGDTAQFEATADWLKSTSMFDAVLTAIEIRGTKFERVAFNFPRGNDKD
jgi:hypothetical protein